MHAFDEVFLKQSGAIFRGGGHIDAGAAAPHPHATVTDWLRYATAIACWNHRLA